MGGRLWRDAAPYFRIFNPITQGSKFDAEGVYTKAYVPELAGLSGKTCLPLGKPNKICWPRQKLQLGRPIRRRLLNINKPVSARLKVLGH